MEEILDKELYFELIKDFESIPFTQTKGWYNYNATLKPNSIRFFVDNSSSPNIACFGHEKHFLGLKMLLIAGESVRRMPHQSKLVKSLYEGIKQFGHHIVEIDSYSIYDPEYEIGARRGGFLRPVGLFSTTMTPIIHLNENIVLDRNWSRNIAKAAQHELKLVIHNEVSEKDIARLVSIYSEMCRRKNFKDRLTNNQLIGLFRDHSMRLFSLVDQNSVTIAYRIIYIHKETAIDVLAANSLPTKYEGATHFFLHEILTHLKSSGIMHFDFSRVLFGNIELEKVAQFKAGIKSEYCQYNGEWAWYKLLILRPMMYWVKRFLMHRVEV